MHLDREASDMANHDDVPEDEILDEYDLRGGIRGKFADRFLRPSTRPDASPEAGHDQTGSAPTDDEQVNPSESRDTPP